VIFHILHCMLYMLCYCLNRRRDLVLRPVIFYRADEFTIETHQLGALERLRIYHDDAGSKPGWFIDSITVLDLKSYRKFNFPCSQWLAKDQGDHEIERELIIEGKIH